MEGLKLTFISESGPVMWPALILTRRSTLILTENCKSFFIGNFASSFGGVIHISAVDSYKSSMTLNDIQVHSDLRPLTTSWTECLFVSKAFDLMQGQCL